MTRRDRCYLVGRRAEWLSPMHAAQAWWKLSRELQELGEKDVPKFNDLLTAIRRITIEVKR
jgi:hypothetical protein